MNNVTLLLTALVCCAPASAGVITDFRVRENLVLFTLSDGSVELEWMSPSTLRFQRCWSPACPSRPPAGEKVTFNVVDGPGQITIRGKYLQVEVDKKDLRLRVNTTQGDTLLAESHPVQRDGGRVVVRRTAAAGERYFGLGVRDTEPLDLRGTLVRAEQPVLISSGGYGEYFASGAECDYDLGHSAVTMLRVSCKAVDRLEYFFYYGPSVKEILEEHLAVIGPIDPVTSAMLEILPDRGLPRFARLLNAVNETVRSWVRRYGHAAFSGVLLPVVDVAPIQAMPEPARRRAWQLAALLPLLASSEPMGVGAVPAWVLETRRRWRPFLLTYLQEVRDRGLPVVRPLAMQFDADEEAARQTGEFLLGDEVLVAPLAGEEIVRKLYLPQGIWTELATNAIFRGRQFVEVKTAPARLPLFTRNGTILPLVAADSPDRLELHYFPRLAAEFFLTEPPDNNISQIHAAPAGDLLRLEIESRVRRRYEWVVHHLSPAERVMEGEQDFRGSWRYDSERRNLHVEVDAAAGADILLNIQLREPL